MNLYNHNPLRVGLVLSVLVPIVWVCARQSTGQAGPDPAIPIGITRSSSPALGSDMWTEEMSRLGLFRPHLNNCDPATEAFVPVTPDGRGFCIEKRPREAMTWEQARNACLQDGKRLPEPAEFKIACMNAAVLGLEDLGPSEWTTNFAFLFSRHSDLWGVAAATTSGECTNMQFGWVGSNAGVQNSLTFRAVR